MPSFDKIIFVEFSNTKCFFYFLAFFGEPCDEEAEEENGDTGGNDVAPGAGDEAAEALFLGDEEVAEGLSEAEFVGMSAFSTAKANSFRFSPLTMALDNILLNFHSYSATKIRF